MNDFSLIWFSSQLLIWSYDKWCGNLKCYSKLLPLYTETRHMGHSSKIKISSKSLCISLYFCMEWHVTNNNIESLGMAHISIETHNMYHQLSVILWYIHWIIVCPQRKFHEETVPYFYTIALYHCFAIAGIMLDQYFRQFLYHLCMVFIVVEWLKNANIFFILTQISSPN